MNNSKKVKIVKLITLIITIAILIVATIYMMPILNKINTTEGQQEFKKQVNEAGVYGPLMICMLEIAQVILAILPGEPVEVLIGICYGPVKGTILIMLSLFVITSIIYLLVKKFGRDFIYEFFPRDKVNKLENSKLFKDPSKVEKVMMILFLIPGTPKDLLIYIGGLLPIKSSKFILMSTLLRFPSVISSTIAGNELIEGKWKISLLAYVVTFIITILILLIINKFDKNNVTKDVVESIKNKEIN